MSFFDPVYQTNDMSSCENDPTDRTIDTNASQSNETLDGRRSIAVNPDESTTEVTTIDERFFFLKFFPLQISTGKIIERIKQIQNSIEQAQTMLDSMEQFRDLVVKKNENLIDRRNFLRLFFFFSREVKNNVKNFELLLEISLNNKMVM